MYPRVVGALPACPKIALSSNPSATVKNGYLGPDDLLLNGNVEALLRDLTTQLVRFRSVTDMPPTHGQRSERQSSGSTRGRELVEALCNGLQCAPSVAIVDDSQMFGGLVALHYSLLPQAKIFGSHGGFTGGGIATAVGVAQADPEMYVVCLAGDQAFTNGVQGLAVAGQLNARLLIIICNNGRSVSLTKQARADGLEIHRDAGLMGNSPNMNYVGIATGYGVSAQRISWLDDRQGHDVSSELTRTIHEWISTPHTHVVEIVTPSDPRFWQDVWIVEGFEQSGFVRPDREAGAPSWASP
jgi:acetolactate synthase-1/2/3 large subunit